MNQWAIYYGDGTRFTDLDGTPWDAPRSNVQIIVQRQPQLGWELLSDSDLYYYEEKRHGFYPCDPTGATFWDHLTEAKYPLILRGRYITDAEFRELSLKVLDDLPAPKTLWRHGEPSWLRGR